MVRHIAGPPRTAPTATPTRAAPRATALLVVAALAGCAVPVPDAPAEAQPSPVQGGAGLELTTEDTGGALLAAQLDLLDAAVAEVAAAFADAAAAARADDLDAARAAGEAAVDLLLGAPEASGVPGLLPSAAADRAGGGSADLVSATVTLAGDVGGDRARVTLELVRDPLVGDLGAWQRDAPGVIDGLRRAVAAAGADPVALDGGIAATAGELTRALGYAMAVASAPDAALAAHAAAAATARLEVVRVALELGIGALSAAAGGSGAGS